MERELRYLNTKVEVREEENKALTLTGYAIRYNEKSHMLGYGFEEIIMPGAFAESLRSKNILALYNHDTNQLLGTTQAGTLKLEDRADGLYFELELLESRAELYNLVKRGDVSGMSFGFTCSEEKYTRNNNTDIREVRKGELFEVSVVHSPAYPTTNVVAKRSLEQYQNFKDGFKQNNDNDLRGMDLAIGGTKNTMEVRCYKPGEKLSGDNSNITIGHLIRAYATGNGTEEEKRMLNSSGASSIIPERISNKLIDLAREKSFLMKNATLVDMQNTQKVTVPKVVKDPTVSFKTQGATITPSEPAFDQIELDAKYIYGLVEIPLEIIQTGIGVEEKINQLLANAIATKMEQAGLKGDVDGFKGIYNETDLLKLDIADINYEEITKGVRAISKNNGETKNIVMNPDSYYTLQTLTTADGQYRVPPTFYNKFKEDVTNAMEENKIFLGDFSQIYLGVLKNISIDISKEYGFGKGTLAVRIMWYGDIAVAQPKHLCLLTKSE